MSIVSELMATTSSAAIDVVEEPFEMGQDGDLMIPEKLLSDYVEMLLLAMMILVGAPLNLLTLVRLINSLKKSKSSMKTKVSLSGF